MKANIEVKDRREADAIKAGLEDPVMRAMVIIIGTLKALPTKRAQARVLQYVSDRLEEEEEARKLQPSNPADTNVSGNGGTPVP